MHQSATLEVGNPLVGYDTPFDLAFYLLFLSQPDPKKHALVPPAGLVFYGAPYCPRYQSDFSI